MSQSEFFGGQFEFLFLRVDLYETRRANMSPLPTQQRWLKPESN
ncbi:hypothetical protein SLEP1_g25522 [Rubroshorea leprosula]|uniref:Ycf15 n=1 Tax=Rubroshorea leprosula TaxID=152421 RepID=A0AAV5JRE1_9ROSI|nr:hypothetical protein SLEP1_g25522 [Rubroshorea leprosula]